MDLIQALGLELREVVSLVGGGGKTTTFYRLARELYEAQMTPFVTTTTKIFLPTPHQCHFLYVEIQWTRLVQALRQNTLYPAIHAAGTEINRDHKLCGLPLEWFPLLLQVEKIDHILIEADGAQSKPLKVPLEHEPVVPSETQMVLLLIGVDVLDQPLSSHWVHRAERAAQMLKVPLGIRIQDEVIRALWNHPEGLTKGIPASAKKIVILNKADTEEQVERALPLASQLAKEGADRVLIASMMSDDPVKEVMIS
jgi:probable selenium-dependent hydroxylase accessory protein YqeC